MTIPARLAFGSAAVLLLCSCDATVVDPATNLTENFVINSDQPAILQTEPRRDSEQLQVPGSPIQEPSMPQPDPKATPPPAKSPAPSPRRVILPSPIQPPAEVDPPHRDPGDEVPQ